LKLDCDSFLSSRQMLAADHRQAYKTYCEWDAHRAGSGNLNNLDKWKFCLNAA
jgi:hypothetical protein